jgi:hypothetical protein
VTQEFWELNLNSRQNPPCPNGDWVANPYFDTFIVKPSSMPVIPGTEVAR